MAAPKISQASEPRKQRGRPKGTGLPPEQRTKPRSVRLTDAQWAKLKALGDDWLRERIDRARLPG